MTDRDLSRLTGVHPQLVAAIRSIFATMDGTHHPMFVVSGVRMLSDQQRLWQIGRDESGRIIGKVVTYKDGVQHKSDHQPHEDGWGHAVDCAFATAEPFALTHPWHVYGETAEGSGLTWGGRWTMRDLPHVELAVAVTEAKSA